MSGSELGPEARAWWDGLYERERQYWLAAAGSERPADAWDAYRAAVARDQVAAEDPLRVWQALGGAGPEP